MALTIGGILSRLTITNSEIAVVPRNINTAETMRNLVFSVIYPASTLNKDWIPAFAGMTGLGD
jgi:hypothetical protein